MSKKKPEYYDMFISEIGSKRTRPDMTEDELKNSLAEWKQAGESLRGWPSDIGTLFSCFNQMGLVGEFRETCWNNWIEYANEQNDIFELNNLIYLRARIYEKSEILNELIFEVDQCVSTLLEMWEGLQRNDRDTILSGMERLRKAHTKFGDLASSIE